MKIDIGCGARKYKGPDGKDDSWIGIDRLAFDGIDIICDVSQREWVVQKEADLINKSVPLFATNNGDEVGEAYIFESESVSEVHTSHFVEHLTSIERIRFCNELYRVLVPGGKCTLIVPHWSSSRAYGDPTHQWPAIGEFWFLYLDKTWRQSQAPATDAAYWPEGYNCDFASQIRYFVNPVVNGLKDEMRDIAIAYGREIILDINATLIKK